MSASYTSSSTSSSGYPTTTVYPAPSLPLDVAWLMRTCSIQGKSRDEGRMIAYLITELVALGLQPQQDDKGNLYVTKGEADLYPCMVAHMDTVHQDVDGFTVGLSLDGHILYAYAESNYQSNLSHLSPAVRQCGVGGDDRCGIHAALQLLKELPYMKAAFWVQEEVGGAEGSGSAYMPFFDNCSMVLQCDRRGSTDWVQTASGTQVASDAFIANIRPFLQERHYTVCQSGGFTDVVNLKTRGLGVSAANMSCGYYAPHTSSETIYLPAFENTLSLCYDIFLALGHERQPHAHVPYKRPEPIVNKAYKRKFSPYHDNTWLHVRGEDNIWRWKKVVDGVIVYQNLTFSETEAAEQAYQLVQKAQQDAELGEEVKKAKKAAKAWVKENGTWEFDKDRKKWIKALPDAEGKRWIVAYAASLLDVAKEELEFQEMYGDDITSGSFDAFEASCWLHDYLQLQEEQEKEELDILEQQWQRTEIIDLRPNGTADDQEDDDYYVGGSRGYEATCAACQTSRRVFSDRSEPQMWCDNCKDFQPKLTGHTVSGSEQLLLGL